MTKTELIDKMAADASITKQAAGYALASILGAVRESVRKKKGKITFQGFGTFYKRRLKATTGRHPQTGQPLKIKARNVVRFRPGAKLREFNY